MKKTVLILLFIIWIIIIYLFSNQPIKDSLSTSSIFVDNAVNIIYKAVPNISKKNLTNKVTFIVRKTAHFTEYLILGIIIYLLLSSFNVSKVFIISILLCFLYACFDEIHQLFVVGRTSKILDVIIDTCGSYLGTIIINKITQGNVYTNLHNSN